MALFVAILRQPVAHIRGQGTDCSACDWHTSLYSTKVNIALEYAIEYMANDDPPAAVLTPTQREYLRGERSPDEASERAMQSRIRKRIRAGLSDFSLLVRTYPDEELRKIYSDDENRVEPLEWLVGFLYFAQPESGMIAEDVFEDRDATTRDRRAAWLESTVKRGVKKAIEHREGIEADVDVSITVDRGEDLESLAEGDLSQLSRDQLDTLLQTRAISGEEYAEANKKRLE